jgi:hypothetical protein
LESTGALRKLLLSMQPWRFESGFGLAAALLVFFAGCEPTARDASDFELERSLAAVGRCHVSVADAASLEFVRAALARHPPAVSAIDCELASADLARLGDDPRIWVGTPNSPGAEAALARLGVERSANGFRFQGEEYSGRCDGLIATLADPERPRALLAIVLGNDVEAALRWVRDWTPTARRGWRVFRAGAIQREGRVGAGGVALAEGSIDVAAVERELSAGLQRGARLDYDWIAPSGFDESRESAWLDAIDRAASGVRSRLNEITRADGLWRLDLRVYDSPEDMSRVCRISGFARLRPREVQDELSLIHVSGVPDNATFEFARALACSSAGEPRSGWLADGVAFASAGSWFGRSGASWLGHLWTGELVPSVEQLTREDAALSPHVAGPLRGALLEFCEELHGPDFAAKAWSATPESLELPGDQEFRAWISRTIGAEAEVASRNRAARRAASLARPARRGACLVASRPGLESTADPFTGGFGSRDCEASLARLRKLGATAVALSWCTAIEATEPAFFGDRPVAWTQADDASLYFTILRAERNGLSVVLLPQLVATENGGWAGQVMLTTQKSQRALFKAWREQLVHLGLLAELAGVDVLSLGTETPDTAVTRESQGNRRRQEDLAGLRQDWKFLIEAARGAFGGGLTYAARWDGEAQGIEFWKDLDFLGQNIFVPCGEPADISPPSEGDFTQRIVGAFAHLSRMSKDNGVRPLVTGIGISSTADGWRQPSRPQGELDLDLQRRFYDGLMHALQQGNRQKVSPAGLFTWCWWTSPQSGGASERGFTPQNKPAEAALERALHVR